MYVCVYDYVYGCVNKNWITSLMSIKRSNSVDTFDIPSIATDTHLEDILEKKTKRVTRER